MNLSTHNRSWKRPLAIVWRAVIMTACMASPMEAQDQTVSSPPEDAPRHGPGREDPVARLTTALGLTPSQQNEVKTLFETMRLKMTEIRDDSILSREAKITLMQELRASTDTAIKALLTADQQKKFDEFQKNHPHRPGDPRRDRRPDSQSAVGPGDRPGIPV